VVSSRPARSGKDSTEREQDGAAQAGLDDHRRGPGHGHRHRQGALAAGHAVVATGRDPQKVEAAVGAADDLLAVTLDVTDRRTPPQPCRPRSTGSAGSTCW
jgi:hypothetical protein